MILYRFGYDNVRTYICKNHFNYTITYKVLTGLIHTILLTFSSFLTNKRRADTLQPFCTVSTQLRGCRAEWRNRTSATLFTS
jgi:hypothetical protein